MIKAKTLIKLLEKVDPESMCNAYEGEDVGISILQVTDNGKKYYWITMSDNEEEDIYTHGFDD